MTPDLRPEDKKCPPSRTGRHQWAPFPERDMDLGEAYRCDLCGMTRWHTEKEK